MNKNFIRYFMLLGLLGIFSSCEKDEDKIYMLENPIAPVIVSMPDMTLQRANGTDTLEFVGQPVDPGFAASANYFLEAALAGTNFADPVIVFSGVSVESIKITESDLNGLMLKKFEADQASSVEFRLRSVLVVAAGTGAPGTSADPFEYTSEVQTSSVTPYGLPRLDLVNSGVDQKIESPLGNGVYGGFVKLNTANPFTLLDPDTNTSYGMTGGALAANGSAISPDDSGWFIVSADINAGTFTQTAYMIGLIGSATPNGWDTPDQKMDYDAKTGTWKITVDLIDGDIKFRKNDGWAWNLGGTPAALTQGGDNLAVTAGNYTITLTIVNDATGTCTLVKN
ncbi:MAG: SusE domain-containing protein [Mangrovibacterium sp.]